MAGRHGPQRETTTTGSVRLTRRHLAGALVAGGALAAIGADLRKGMGRAASAQADIAATPPPVPVGTGYVSTAPTIAGKAAELGYDLDRIVAFVRTGVRYEPYAGALRGALGVLWSGAGNSVDQALLLAALLDESQIVCRVVTGELSAEGQQALLTAAGGGADGGMAGTPAATPSPPANLPTGTPPPGLGSLEPAYDRSRQLYREAVDTIGAALAAAAIVLPVAMPPTLPDSEVYAHMWVEVADGPRWIRHDPTAGPDAGTAAVSATPLAGATPVAGDDPAAGLTHTVRVRIVAEELSAGTGVQRDVVTWEGTSIDLLATPVGVLIQTPADLDGLGYTISEMFTGAASFVPVLAVGDDVRTAATPVVLGSSGSSSLAGALDAATPEGGGADGELVALWLTVDIQSPGRDPVSVQRTILDRIGVARRAAATIDYSPLAPVSLVTNVDTGQQTIPEFAALTLLTVESADLPPAVVADQTAVLDTWGALQLMGPSFSTYRRTLGRLIEQPAGIRTFAQVPGVVAFTLGRDDPSSPDSPAHVAMDILFRDPGIDLTETPPADAPNASLAAGVLDQVAEEMLFDPTLRGAAASAAPPAVTVGAVFAAAKQAGVAVVVVTDESSLSRITAPDEAMTRLAAVIAQGLVAVVPVQPVTVLGTPRTGWWVVDPATGRTRDELDNGGGYAGTTAGPVRYALQTVDYGVLLARLRAWAVPFSLLGRCIAIVTAAAVAQSDFGGSEDAYDSFIEVLKNVDQKDLAGCFG